MNLYCVNGQIPPRTHDVMFCLIILKETRVGSRGKCLRHMMIVHDENICQCQAVVQMHRKEGSPDVCFGCASWWYQSAAEVAPVFIL